jgi:Flavodoxin-like fold
MTERSSSTEILAVTPARGVNVLIIYAHPEPTSFAGALKNVAVSALTAAGHRVEVSDLYAEGFNPVAGRHDFKNAADLVRFHSTRVPHFASCEWLRSQKPRQRGYKMSRTACCNKSMLTRT